MFNSGFYPTPKHLIDKMINHIDFNKINSILEPSAGKGDIIEVINKKMNYSNGYYNKEHYFDIDAIEIDTNLQYILKGKNFRVVHNDFLNYNTYKKYDLIIMNPPFSEGDKHLLKAIQMQEKGGQIVCLLNAETLKNPYSNSRKDLINKLNQYNADVEYIQNAFLDAERKTPVEVALIKINIPKKEYNSDILIALKQEEQYQEQTEYNNNYLIENDFIKGIIQQYNFEVKAGLKLIAEYKAMIPLLYNSLKDDYYKSPILELKLNHNDNNSTTIENDYIKQVRMKYWKALFESDQFIGLFTSNLKEKYYNKIDELKNYDFSLYNIYSIRADLSKEMIKGVEETILNLFEELSYKHYYDEMSNNIHYYNGWKTNKAYKINKRVIIPLNGFRYWGDKITYDYKVIDKLSDIEKVFNYLDGGLTEHVDIEQTLKMAKYYGETKKIELKYFYVTFYKKGTCHIQFKNLELLHKFNLFGSQRKGWLPPAYGKKSYEDMTKEEQTIIDNFEGKESYNKVMKNKKYYLTDFTNSNLLMLVDKTA